MEIYCKKCGSLAQPTDFNCSECGNMVDASKCYLCNIELDNLNKFICDKQKIADGRTVLVCIPCKEIYTEALAIARERDIKIEIVKM